MEKAKVIMTNWEITYYKGEYNLEGRADNHPQLGRNVYVTRTSNLVDYGLIDDQLIYETKNTIYICPLKYLKVHPYGRYVQDAKLKYLHMVDEEDTYINRILSASAKLAIEHDINEGASYEKFDENNLSDVDLEDEFLLHIKELQMIGHEEIKAATEKEEKRMMEIAAQYNNCIYIEVTDIDNGDMLAYHLGDDSGVVYPDVHVGTYQDSILYMQYADLSNNNVALDFRYFPKWNSIETYSWSDNIERAIIKNASNNIIVFNNVEIDPGAMKIFGTDTHSEGLISPDCYNGKSIISNCIKHK